VIVADTSALMAIALDEPAADQCDDFLSNQIEILISAGSLTEAFVVAARRNVTEALEALLLNLPYVVVPVTEPLARRAGMAYRQWGKGFHPAGLNFGDCFAYALAKEQNCPLLFIGNDFSRTDVLSALTVEGSA
jgi:ribonuclease VapC